MINNQTPYSGSTTGQTTIDYVATDQNGLISTSTRTVFIEPILRSQR